mgnify:CR=1 FL=1
MGVTPTYNFPYPELGDSPNGPVQIQALAQAVEDQLEVTDATVGTHTGQISTLNTNVTNITRRAKTADAGINQTATSGVVALNAATVTQTGLPGAWASRHASVSCTSRRYGMAGSSGYDLLML